MIYGRCCLQKGNTFTTVIASLLMFNVHVQPRMHGFQEPFNEYL